MNKSLQNAIDQNDPRLRSLLQKAVRRGHADLVIDIAAMVDDMGSNARNWFRTRTAVMTFEECWPLGRELVFERSYHSKVAKMVQVTLSQKSRDATGLAYLAQALSQGDRSPLRGDESDRDIRIVANGILRPQPFWQWIQSEAETGIQQHFATNALRFRRAGKPRDQAVAKAAAYLALKDPIPRVRRIPANRRPFPYWVALDVHTTQGRRVLRDVSRDLFIPLPQLEWVVYYFEGTLTNGSAPSEWWDRWCRWYFQKIGLRAEEAHLLWDPVKEQVIDALKEDSRRLHRRLYAWKLDHHGRVDALTRQISTVLENEGDACTHQRSLFDSQPR